MTDLLDDNASDASLGRMLSPAQLWSDLRTYYLLLITFIVLALAAVVAYTAIKPPVYAATAIVGPADNSDRPFGQGMGGALAGGLGGITRHLHVGGGLAQGSDDTFDEYTSLLTSNRLAEILVRKDNVLPAFFPEQWDGSHHRWLPRSGAIDQFVDYLKTILRRPVKPAPDQDDLEKYFQKNLIVDSSLETSFATVTFRFSDRAGAERLLGLILHEADDIIRQDKRSDVAARIAYLDTALVHLSLADQKPELIAILSEQQQEMMMIESDHLYASKMIDAPYAPLKPVSPSPVIDSFIALGLSCVGWLALVRMTPDKGFLARFIAAFGRGRRGRWDDKGTHSAPALHDPLAAALPIPGVLDGAPDVVNPRGGPGKGRA